MGAEEDARENAYTTYGSFGVIDSTALDFLYEKLEGNDRKSFFKTAKTCWHQCRRAQTPLVMDLLKKYFLNKITDDQPYASYKRNVITTICREEKAELLGE